MRATYVRPRCRQRTHGYREDAAAGLECLIHTMRHLITREEHSPDVYESQTTALAKWLVFSATRRLLAEHGMTIDQVFGPILERESPEWGS